MTRLGDRLRNLRGKLSLLDIQKETGLYRIDIQRFELGAKAPRPHNLKKLAECYELSYKELRKLYYEDLYADDPEELAIVLEWAKEHKKAKREAKKATADIKTKK
ncbi:MAG: helix-turn-helix domain-containing protein [Vampirovibrio sp.]|nr:helix-turn-helix domain-containing protein [Vampirovibrio sp.]